VQHLQDDVLVEGRTGRDRRSPRTPLGVDVPKAVFGRAGGTGDPLPGLRVAYQPVERESRRFGQRGPHPP
jgi:hypothetical protein